MNMCDDCVAAHGSGPVRCKPCYDADGRTCIVCKQTPAQNQRTYLHRCKKCMADQPDDAIQALLAQEATEYLDRERQRERQTWTGQEPALQQLCLPSNETLPSYADRPEYLSPNHCRLCLQALGDETLQSHLDSRHDGLSASNYRHRVLRSALTEWPQPVAPQVLRSRLAAFK